MSDGVAVYMRVEGKDEICIGHVANYDDTPALLHTVAELWRGRRLREEKTVNLYPEFRNPPTTPPK